MGVSYENGARVAPLFAALENEDADVVRVFANVLVFDPAGRAPDWSLAVNKVSPSSYLRGHAASIRAARDFVPFLERRGVPVVNGSQAFALETSKARQLALLAELGVRAPAARVVTDVAQIPDAARELRYPLIVKPNVGGSGAIMRRVDADDELSATLPTLDLGPDGTGIVQEFLETADGSIQRVEFLDGEYLYAIKIHNESSRDFNLCPADICQTPDGEKESRATNGSAARSESGSRVTTSGWARVPTSGWADNCVVDASAKRALTIEAIDAPTEIVDDVLRIARGGGLDVGGVEYLIAARDGLPYVYDINALSNFVTEAVELVGFDPHARFARWLVGRANATGRRDAVAVAALAAARRRSGTSLDRPRSAGASASSSRHLRSSQPRPDCAWAARCTRSWHAYAAFVPAASSASTSPSSARTVTTARPSSSSRIRCARTATPSSASCVRQGVVS